MKKQGNYMSSQNERMVLKLSLSTVIVMYNKSLYHIDVYNVFYCRPVYLLCLVLPNVMIINSTVI